LFTLKFCSHLILFLQKGETYESNAIKELQEEAGISTELTTLFDACYDSNE
jgi:ADP-ribose pyrophosphatase YjhB (NUDIX family)